MFIEFLIYIKEFFSFLCVLWIDCREKWMRKRSLELCVRVYVLSRTPHPSPPLASFCLLEAPADAMTWLLGVGQRWALDHCTQQSTQQQHKSHTLTHARICGERGGLLLSTRSDKKKTKIGNIQVKEGKKMSATGGHLSSYCSTKKKSGKSIRFVVVVFFWINPPVYLLREWPTWPSTSGLITSTVIIVFLLFA